MADNLKGVPFSSPDEGKPFSEIARDIVYADVLARGRAARTEFTRDDVYIVWFCYIMGNWKALCSTTLTDGRYYEVTVGRQGDRTNAYLDTYVKESNDWIETP